MKDWKEYKLGDVLNFYNGKEVKIKDNDIFPVYGSNGIIGFHNESYFENSVIIGRVGAYCGAVFYEKNKFWASDNTIVVKEKNGFDITFIFYLLSFFDLNSFSGGSAQPLLTHSYIKPIKLKLPPLPIQQKIAAILSRYDDLIENNLKQIKLLEEMAQITYQEWFVRLKFPNHENTPMDEKTGLPVEWKKVKVDFLLGKIQTTLKIKSDKYQIKGLIPIIDQSRDFIAGHTDNNEALVDIGKPIIVFGDHTRILKFINFPFARGADGTQLMLSNNSRMPQHLFYFSLLNADLSDFHYARHYKFLKETEIVFPLIDVAELFEEKAAKNFEAIKFLRNQNQLLKEARDILLPRLMTGKITLN